MAKAPWQYLGRKSHCWKSHFFLICFFVKFFSQRLLSLVNMGLHAAIIRLSPLIHEGEQRYKPYIVGDPRMVTPPLKNPGYAPDKVCERAFESPLACLWRVSLSRYTQTNGELYTRRPPYPNPIHLSTLRSRSVSHFALHFTSPAGASFHPGPCCPVLGYQMTTKWREISFCKFQNIDIFVV